MPKEELNTDLAESGAGVLGMGALAGIAAAITGIVGGLLRGFGGWPTMAIIVRRSLGDDGTFRTMRRQSEIRTQRTIVPRGPDRARTRRPL